MLQLKTAKMTAVGLGAPFSITIVQGQGCTVFLQYLVEKNITTFKLNGFSHRYQLGEITFIFRGVRSDFIFCLIFG